jgi:hypothetical protein
MLTTGARPSMFSVTSVLTVSPPSPSAVPRTIWPAPDVLTKTVSVQCVARAQRNSTCAPVFIQPRSFGGGEGTAKICG